MISQEISNYKNKFNEIYYNDILPFYKTYEPERKKRLAIMLTVLVISLILLIYSGVYYFSNPHGILQEIIGLVVGIPAGLAAICVPSFMCFSFVQDIKSECMKKALSAMGNIEWKQASFISEKELINSELFDENLALSTDDSFSGVYNGVSFKISELLLSGEAAKTIFKGAVISFKSNKTIKNKTIIATKADRSLRKQSYPYFLQAILSIVFLILAIGSFIAAFTSNIDIPNRILFLFFGGFSSFFIYIMIADCVEKHKKNSEIIKKENLKPVKVEDIVFSKKYVAYSSDQVEGRYLITPAFMERFKNLQTAFGTNKIKCSFVGDRIMFAISTNKNLFEIGSIFQSLTNPKIMEKFFSELTSIYLIIDYLKLNENTKL